VKVYYLGPPGTFGEQAALDYTQRAGLKAELTPLPSHADIVAAVDAGRDEMGVVAIQNSLGGGVVETMDAILASRDVMICAEQVLAIEQHLIAAPGLALSDIEVVISHTQALSQCRSFLGAQLPGVRLEAALSTVAAVEEAVRTPNAAAIAHQRAAELHGGHVLARNIQDVSNNETRFLILAHEDAPATGDDKTSLAFTVPDKPGAVVSVMQEFSTRGINLTLIESRPSRQKLYEYVFLLDFQGHRFDPEPAAALKAITQDVGATLLPAGKPLGSYPRFVG
jgi:prephenate dehydratase